MSVEWPGLTFLRVMLWLGIIGTGIALILAHDVPYDARAMRVMVVQAPVTRWILLGILCIAGWGTVALLKGLRRIFAALVSIQESLEQRE